MPNPVCLDDYRTLARDRVSAEVWDFIEGGSGAEVSLGANEAAFDRIQLRPRVLVDVSTVDTSTSLLGAPLAFPVGVAPTAFHRLVHGDGEIGTAAGAGGALYIVSIFATQPLERIAAAATGPLWLQVYWFRRRDVLVDVIARTRDAGFRAIVLTVDTPRVGLRLRDLRNGFAVDPGIRAVNLDEALTAAAHHRQAGESAIATHAAQEFDQTITWADLAWLREVAGLPIVLKGILTAEDADRAVSHGAAGVIVSNHGGRQLDGTPAGIDVLPEVVDAVAGAVPVLVDGGVRRGTHVFAALALGASAVLVGRPILWALACAGGDGVKDLLGMLHNELAHTMALAGRPRLTDIDRTAVT